MAVDSSKKEIFSSNSQCVLPDTLPTSLTLVEVQNKFLPNYLCAPVQDQ